MMNRCRQCGHSPGINEPDLIDGRCWFCLDSETDGPLWDDVPDTDDRGEWE